MEERREMKKYIIMLEGDFSYTIDRSKVEFFGEYITFMDGEIKRMIPWHRIKEITEVIE